MQKNHKNIWITYPLPYSLSGCICKIQPIIWLMNYICMFSKFLVT